MAGELSTAIGEALLQLVVLVWPSSVPQLSALAEKVADVVRPDPPFTLTTQDGEVVTGVVVLDHRRALLFIGTRQAAVSRPAYRPPERDLQDRGYPERERSYDADQSLWSPRPYTR